jgi:transcriptional antiterminator RfaH
MANDAEKHRAELTARINAKRAAYQDSGEVLPPTRCANANERWSVVQTGEHQEASAARRLRKLGFEVYLPRLIEMRKDYRKHRGKRRVLVPLFAEYLFVKVNVLMRRWGDILHTIGVEGVLLAGEVPAQLPDELIEILARRYREIYSDADAAPGVVVQAKKPEQGSTVQITDGPFKFWDAKVEDLSKFDSQHRIGLLLAVLGRPVRVEVDADSVAQV